MNKYDIAAIAAIEDLDSGEYQKLSASKQREIFGSAIFGRKSVCFDPAAQGTVWVSRSAGLGTDSVSTNMSYEKFADYVNEQKPIIL